MHMLHLVKLLFVEKAEQIFNGVYYISSGYWNQQRNTLFIVKPESLNPVCKGRQDLQRCVCVLDYVGTDTDILRTTSVNRDQKSGPYF